MESNGIMEHVIGTASWFHKHLGPGRLESACEECLSHGLSQRGVPFERQRFLPIEYEGFMAVLKGGIPQDAIRLARRSLCSL